MGNGDPNSGPEDKDCIWGLPLLLWGSPGIGKSRRVKDAGKAAYLTVKSVFAATRAPEDFSGAPVVKNGELVVECILGAVRELCTLGRGVLFLDEISCAVPAVQAALLSVVLDRTVGDTQIPPEVRILSAANPPSEAAGGWELEPPMANRFAHLTVSDPSSADWVNWLLGQGKEESIEAELGEAMITENWPRAWSKTKGIMAGFFRNFPDGKLFNMPKPGSKDRGRAWPSPRSWEMASRAVATCYAVGADQATILEFVAACVGHGVALEWSTWVNAADLPDPLTVVTQGWEPDKRRLDRTAAVIASVAEFTISEKDQEKRNKYAVGAWDLFTKTKKAGLLDLVVPAAKRFQNAKLNVSNGSPEVAAAAREVLKELGLTGMGALADKGAKQ